ncbi:glycosyltransferase [Kaistella carnis]|uniref:glycosyltransferase n=1 Tax=Kaistella carnis TaxID=1241979 RepID=UPI00289F505F|nr:glycosyltransferase [Kaistella carnis]
MDRAGAETMVMNLYREMDREKIQFDFVVFSNGKGDYDDEIETLGGKIFHIIANNPIERIFKLRNLLKQNQEYKVIHSHTLLSTGFHLFAGSLADVPFRIAHAHSTNDNFKWKIIGKVYQFITKQLIKKNATHLIACGLEAGQFLFETDKNVLFLPNAIDIETFAEVGHHHKSYWQDNYGITSNTLKILQVGRLMPVKNPFFSLKIAESLKKSNVDFKLFFVGQGPLLNDLKIEISNLNLKENVELLGMRSDIPQLMAGADVLLMPSFHEGFPVVLVESQAVGLPAVISDGISAEVDLNVGLIHFESLTENIEKWKGKLMSTKNITTIKQKERIFHLSKQGFDIKSSAAHLFALYNKMI